MTHTELMLYTLVKRQGSVGASWGFIKDRLNISATRLWQIVNGVNAKLVDQRIKTDGSAYRLVDTEEANFMAAMAVADMADNKCSGVWA